MTITNVGSIEIVVYPSGSSPTSTTTLPAPITNTSVRPDSILPLLGSRVSAIPAFAECTLQPIENRVPQQFSFIQVRLAKAFVKSRDGGGCWMLSLNYTAFLCGCIGFTILFPAVFLIAWNAGCYKQLEICSQVYNNSAGAAIGGAVAILLSIGAIVARCQLKPYNQFASNPHVRFIYNRV